MNHTRRMTPTPAPPCTGITPPPPPPLRMPLSRALLSACRASEPQKRERELAASGGYRSCSAATGASASSIATVTRDKSTPASPPAAQTTPTKPRHKHDTRHTVNAFYYSKAYAHKTLTRSCACSLTPSLRSRQKNASPITFFSFLFWGWEAFR